MIIFDYDIHVSWFLNTIIGQVFFIGKDPQIMVILSQGNPIKKYKGR